MLGQDRAQDRHRERAPDCAEELDLTRGYSHNLARQAVLDRKHGQGICRAEPEPNHQHVTDGSQTVSVHIHR